MNKYMSDLGGHKQSPVVREQAKEKLAEIKKISGTQTRLWSKTGPIFPEELFKLIEQAGFELPL